MRSCQPFLFRHNTGDFALAHNGNIVNSELLRLPPRKQRQPVPIDHHDSEILAHLIKKGSAYHDWPRIFSIIDAEHTRRGLSRSSS